MLDLFRDLFRHEAWADAEHWRAIEANPAAAADAAIRERLNHIHIVQRWYLTLFRGNPMSADEAMRPIASRDELLNSFRCYHEGMRGLLEQMPVERLDEIVELAAKPNPIAVSVRDALLQVVMHSQNHRGQNARRLRELAGDAPLTDYLLWVIKGRPEPAWE